MKYWTWNPQFFYGTVEREKQGSCFSLKICILPTKLYAEIQIPKVMVIGEGVFGD